MSDNRNGIFVAMNFLSVMDDGQILDMPPVHCGVTDEGIHVYACSDPSLVGLRLTHEQTMSIAYAKKLRDERDAILRELERRQQEDNK